jgi:hypothetical protein
MARRKPTRDPLGFPAQAAAAAVKAIEEQADCHAANVLPIIREIKRAGVKTLARHCRGAECSWCAYGARRALAGDDSLECALACLTGRWNSSPCPTLASEPQQELTNDLSKPHRPSANVHRSRFVWMGHRRSRRRCDCRGDNRVS